MFTEFAALVIGAGFVLEAVPAHDVEEVRVAELATARRVQVGPHFAGGAGDLAPVRCVGRQRVGAQVAAEAQQFVPAAGAAALRVRAQAVVAPVGFGVEVVLEIGIRPLRADVHSQGVVTFQIGLALVIADGHPLRHAKGGGCAGRSQVARGIGCAGGRRGWQVDDDVAEDAVGAAIGGRGDRRFDLAPARLASDDRPGIGCVAADLEVDLAGVAVDPPGTAQFVLAVDTVSSLPLGVCPGVPGDGAQMHVQAVVPDRGGSGRCVIARADLGFVLDDEHAVVGPLHAVGAVVLRVVGVVVGRRAGDHA